MSTRTLVRYCSAAREVCVQLDDPYRARLSGSSSGYSARVTVCGHVIGSTAVAVDGDYRAVTCADCQRMQRAEQAYATYRALAVEHGARVPVTVDARRALIDALTYHADDVYHHDALMVWLTDPARLLLPATTVMDALRANA